MSLRMRRVCYGLRLTCLFTFDFTHKRKVSTPITTTFQNVKRTVVNLSDCIHLPPRRGVSSSSTSWHSCTWSQVIIDTSMGLTDPVTPRSIVLWKGSRSYVQSSFLESSLCHKSYYETLVISYFVVRPFSVRKLFVGESGSPVQPVTPNF